MTEERQPNCRHKEIDEDGICKACGARAAIEIRGLSKGTNTERRNALDMRTISSTPAPTEENLERQPNTELRERAREFLESHSQFHGYPERAIDFAAAFAASIQAEKNTAYAERDKLVCALSKLFPASLERHPDSDTTWENDWRWIVFLDLPTGQATWHIHDSELWMFDHLQRNTGRVWDGHTTPQKYFRLGELSASIQAEAEIQRKRADFNFESYIKYQQKTQELEKQLAEARIKLEAAEQRGDEYKAALAEARDQAWINCSERLPEIGQEVSILTNISYHRARYAMPAPDKPLQWGWYGTDGTWYAANSVTHWQEIAAAIRRDGDAKAQTVEAFEIHNRFCGENGEPCQVCRLKAEREEKK